MSVIEQLQIGASTHVMSAARCPRLIPVVVVLDNLAAQVTPEEILRSYPALRCLMSV